jgi:hypothetical protein
MNNTGEKIYNIVCGIVIALGIGFVTYYFLFRS